VEGSVSYLTPEARARVRIDEMLTAAGWAVQDARAVNLSAARGVAVREFVLKRPHGRVDYLLFVDREAVGVLEAKKQGETLTGVAWQTARYLDGIPDDLPAALEGALTLVYQSTGVETRFMNTLDEDISLAVSQGALWTRTRHAREPHEGQGRSPETHGTCMTSPVRSS
jgi:type I site-specific restriction endonuclease